MSQRGPVILAELGGPPAQPVLQVVGPTVQRGDAQVLVAAVVGPGVAVERDQLHQHKVQLG